MAAEVLPHLQKVWDAEGWETKWWPSDAGASRPGRVRHEPVRRPCRYVTVASRPRSVSPAAGRPSSICTRRRGPGWDGFLDALAERHTVYAPDHPGTGETDRYAIHRVPALWDLVLIYDELLDALGLDSVPLVGARSAA